MKKYLVLTCYGYKGGELGTPYCYNSITECIYYIDDLFYHLDKEEKYDFIENWPEDEELTESIKTFLSIRMDNIYAGTDENVVEYWELDTEINKMQQLSLENMMSNFDIELFKQLELK